MVPATDMVMAEAAEEVDGSPECSRRRSTTSRAPAWCGGARVGHGDAERRPWGSRPGKDGRGRSKKRRKEGGLWLMYRPSGGCAWAWMHAGAIAALGHGGYRGEGGSRP